MIGEIPEDSGTVISVKAENIPPTSPANGPKPHDAPKYDPAMVYIMEFCTVLALRDDESMKLIGKRVVDALQAVLRDASRYSPVLVGRTSFYLFKLLHASYVCRTPALSPFQFRVFKVADKSPFRTMTLFAHQCFSMLYRASPKIH